MPGPEPSLKEKRARRHATADRRFAQDLSRARTPREKVWAANRRLLAWLAVADPRDAHTAAAELVKTVRAITRKT